MPPPLFRWGLISSVFFFLHHAGGCHCAGSSAHSSLPLGVDFICTCFPPPPCWRLSMRWLFNPLFPSIGNRFHVYFFSSTMLSAVTSAVLRPAFRGATARWAFFLFHVFKYLLPMAARCFSRHQAGLGYGNRPYGPRLVFVRMVGVLRSPGTCFIPGRRQNRPPEDEGPEGTAEGWPQRGHMNSVFGRARTAPKPVTSSCFFAFCRGNSIIFEPQPVHRLAFFP